MPISIVVGGQFGSEGKGKVAHWLASVRQATCAVRVGGSNSGHTVVDGTGKRLVLRHLPTASILPNVQCFLGAGTYIDPAVLRAEIRAVGLQAERLFIDANAVVLGAHDPLTERLANLGRDIGSTESGTGAGVAARIQRRRDLVFAKDHPDLRRFVTNTRERLGQALDSLERVVIEGTQGFGLSLLHSPHYPYVTSRDTTAAGFLSEVGLSPMDVDEVVLVLRTYPIRVSGNSGPLPNETDWPTVSRLAKSTESIVEYTSVTKRIRRVAMFDGEIVRSAIRANRPSLVVLNHVDYFDSSCKATKHLTNHALDGVSRIESEIGRTVDLVGTTPESVLRPVASEQTVSAA